MVAKASPIYKESRRRSADATPDTQEGDEEFVTVRWGRYFAPRMCVCVGGGGDRKFGQ